MSNVEQYRRQIEAILGQSDLSTITTKSIRRALETQLGISLDPIKKEINPFIEEIFVDFQEIKQPTQLQPPKATAIKKGTAVTKKIVKKDIKKVEKKKPSAKKEPKERKPTNQPLLKVAPPLSTIIRTNLCSRPQAVKKVWDYIKEHNLQSETDKRIIICDENFKAVCEGLDQVSGFAMNKYFKKYYETIPKEEQAKYKEILRAQEGDQSEGHSESVQQQFEQPRPTESNSGPTLF